MRLTLRTMLAYLDRTLDHTDADELSEKIQESEFATGLVHRIRSATRHLRLGAPKLHGKGVGQDPNSVAEYLDSTLPQERVPDFERVCLESDVQLAEVAACHQILARVLGEPAHIETDMRERMYNIEELGRKKAEAEKVAAPPVTNDHAEEKAVIESYEEVAEKTAIKPWAIAIALLLLIGVLFAAMGPLDSNHPVLGSLFPDDTPIANGPEADPKVTDPAPKGKVPDAPQVDPKGQEPKSPGVAEPNVAPTEPVTEPPATPVEPAKSDPGGDAKSPTAITDPALTPAVDPKSAPVPEPAPATPVVREVGRYLSSEQALLRFDNTENSWSRLQAPSVLRSGDRLTVLPTFRPPVVLTNSIQMIFAGSSAAEIGVPDENDAPNVSLSYGRAVFVTAGKAGAQAHLVLDGRAGSVTFGDATSAMAVEVTKYLPPGVNPEETTAQRVIQLFATGAEITWSDGKNDVTIAPGNVLTMIDDKAPDMFATGDAPGWIDLQPLTDGERLASRGLEPFLKLDRPVSLSMQEQVSFRKVEVASLAIRSLSHLGLYEPLVDSLGNEWQHSYWPAHFDELRAAIARSPAGAESVRISIEKSSGAEAELLYRLLWMFSPKQLADGEAGHLVELLEHDSMPVRVLAYENLLRITGRNFFYKPEREAERQKDKIRRWRELLDQGQILYVTEPAPLPARSKP